MRLRLLLAVTGLVAGPATAAAVLHESPRHSARPVAAPVVPDAARGPISAALGAADPAYAVTGLVARNAGHGVRARFGRTAVTLRSRGGRASIALDAVGRAGTLRAVAAATPRVAGNRVSYDRGAVREWWANGPLGLEQGFDLATRPAGHGALTLALDVPGATARGGRALALPAGLRYSGLRADDAAGRQLPARLTVGAGGRVLVRVDDRAARYPIRVDPFIQDAKLQAPDGVAGDLFGAAVAASTDTIVVGAPGRQGGRGAAYVFVKGEAGWAHVTPSATLTASDGAAADTFGTAVGTSGTTVAVGAPARAGGRGGVYVFERPATGWADAQETAALALPAAAAGDALGSGVAVSGTTVAAGAPGRAAGAGSAVVWERPATGWDDGAAPAATLTASDAAAGDALGAAVALTGDTLVAGAPQRAGATGAAYLFTRPAGGWATATQTARLTTSDASAGDLGGGAVAVEGGTVVVGTPGRSAAAGGASLYVRPPAGWADATETAALRGAVTAAGDRFGAGVGVSGNTVAVGAPLRNIGASTDGGGLYVIIEPAGGWRGTVLGIFPGGSSDSTAGDHLGGAVALAGDSAVGGGTGREADRGEIDVFVQATPTVTFDTPAFGATYTQGQVVAADYTCRVEAGGSGLASCTGSVADGAPLDTSTPGEHTVTVTAVDGARGTTTETATYTVVAAPATPQTPAPDGPQGPGTTTPPADTTAPVLSAVGQTRSRWRRDDRRPRAAVTATPVGTTFRFTLDEPATVRLHFDRRLVGRTVLSHCTTLPAGGRTKRPCVRLRSAGTITVHAHAGVNTVRFGGRVWARRKLHPGRFRLTVTASNAAGAAAAAPALGFTIVG